MNYVIKVKPNIHQSDKDNRFYVGIWDENTQTYYRRLTLEEQCQRDCVIEEVDTLEALTRFGNEAQARRIAKAIYGYSAKAKGGLTS